MEEGIRIDKWLWAVRLFKTRSQATEACKSGNVMIDRQKVKASRKIKPGDKIDIHFQPINKRIMVEGLIEHRIGTKLVSDYLIDLTPEEEYQKLKLMKEVNFEFRERGAGRPTKLQRRQIAFLKEHLHK